MIYMDEFYVRKIQDGVRWLAVPSDEECRKLLAKVDPLTIGGQLDNDETYDVETVGNAYIIKLYAYWGIWIKQYRLNQRYQTDAGIISFFNHMPNFQSCLLAVAKRHEWWINEYNDTPIRDYMAKWALDRGAQLTDIPYIRVDFYKDHLRFFNITINKRRLQQFK
jgi:hypothetical protein